jgi:UPF0716 protein FxsA
MAGFGIAGLGSVGRRLRLAVGLFALAEVVVFILVASWIGVGATILLALLTSVLGWTLVARQGMRALGELRDRARTRQPPGRELGDAGLVAAGGALMLLPGFIGDVLGLLCLLPITRRPLRGLLARVMASRLPVGLRGPVHVRSDRTAPVGGATAYSAAPLVIEGDVLDGDVSTPHRS